MNKYIIPSIFKPFRKQVRYKVGYGGRGSGKSWSFALMAIMLAQSTNNLLFLCVREIQNSIEDSVYRLLCNIIGSDYGWNITKNEIIHKKTKSRFIFKGLYRNINSIKSIEGVNICWIEEAQSVSQESLDYLIPTIRVNYSQIWVTFNPENDTDPVYDMFVKNQRDDAVIKKINYSDNPHFPDTLKAEMEYDKRVDYEKYLWVWEGELRQVSDAQVFKNKYRSESFETPDNIDFYYGADWGFSNDPTVMIRSFILDNKLYIDYEAYQVGCDIDDTPALFDPIPQSREWTSRADCSRPETISYLNKSGYPLMIGEGKIAVEDGVMFIRSFDEVVIHSRCKHTLDEFKLYSYHVDKRSGDITPRLEDKNNHCIDALRYALQPLISNNVSMLDVI